MDNQQHDGGQSEQMHGGIVAGSDDKASTGRRASTSSIPLQSTLSNAFDLRPGSFPDGHPMSRVRSSADLNQIAWLTAKVRKN